MTVYLKDALGCTASQEYKLDATNSIDVYPNAIFEPQGVSSPDYGTITIQGITYPTQLWDDSEYVPIKVELNHQYEAGEDCDIHIRAAATDDTAGTAIFTYEYFVCHVDNTTSAGDTVTITATIEAGSSTANKIYYASTVIDGTNLVAGDMLIGKFTRSATGTYGADVSLAEIGLHIPVGRVGANLGG